MTLRRVLVANRGEIACRIFRSCRRLGIGTVAVYSEADAGALHVAMADAAVPVGAAPARESYLDIGRIIEAARATDADAVHPGYGFLSENPAFAEACEAAGLRFIGPSPAAMRAMGMKDAAKTLAARLGVPVLPGYAGEDQSEARLLAEAEAIGWPVLIKAVAGGGGRGMRRVDGPASFARALAAAKREAGASFGHDSVLVERCVIHPRHVEVQVFADIHGNAVHLFERDCSIQRRHQKIIEEAPAPGVSEAMRAAMGEAALRLVRAVDYAGAGTVEFIADMTAGQ
ncbi:MAG TPA: biotin carboxylase N-terminal domain-containing protein, partial [Acetobacteraceae bacterium]